MKKVIFIAAAMAALLFAGRTQAYVCEIINSSFEDDEWIDDIMVIEPNGWDVDGPADKFGGYVYQEFVTDANFNLTLFPVRYATFDVDDMATVSQEVCLMDVNQIIFDLKLHTINFTEWDPNICAAVLLIDDDVVWESNSTGPDVRGEYLDQAYTVEDKYRVAGMQKLSLGVRVNVADMLLDYYETHWDFIRFTSYCGGLGLLQGDFDRDCYVDINDLKLLTLKWLDEVDPNDRYNLYGHEETEPYGIIDFLDFAVYADSWDGNMPDLKMFVDVWLDEVDVNNIYNLFQDNDVGPRGVVNFFDFAIFADDWLKTSYEQNE